MRADGTEVDRLALGLQQDGRPPDDQLTDPAGAEPAADHDALGVLPALRLHEAADHARQLLGEVLDRAVHDTRRLVIALRQELVELLLADLLARLLAERV